MPENWKTYKLGDVAKIKYGKDHKKLKQGTIPCYGTGGIMRYVDSFLSQEESVLIPRKGSLNNIFYINKPFWTVDTLFWTKVNNDIAFTKYLYYYLTTIDFVSKDVGSAIPSLTTSLLNVLEIILPSLPEQRAIANILSALDNKIENNLAMNKTLEDMAMALYKHWFVDFGPFQEGRFIDSELGKIPEEWEVKKLEDIIESLSKGTTPRKKDVDNIAGSVPFLKVKDIDDFGLIDESGLEHIPDSVHNKQLKRSILESNDILISIAGTIGRIAIVPSNLEGSNCNQALAFIRLSDKKMNNGYIYLWLKSSQTQKKINMSIVQGVQANLSLGVLKGLEFSYPSEKILKAFNIEVLNKLEMISSNRKENQTLTKLRDTLLPKLISGEVRVRDVEHLVSEVL